MVLQAPQPPRGCPERPAPPAGGGGGQSIHASDGTYGSPRVVVDLWEAGWQVSVNLVAAIMAERGLVARPKRVRRSMTKQGKRAAYPDLVVRKFAVDRPCPDQVWVGHVTLIRTLEGPPRPTLRR